MIVSIVGITKLEVENSFINYFDKETEIYKGMKLIDKELGGTTPLDVIVKFPKKRERAMKQMMTGVKRKKTMQNIGLLETK